MLEFPVIFDMRRKASNTFLKSSGAFFFAEAAPKKLPRVF